MDQDLLLYLLEASSSLIWILGISLFFLILFHILLIRLYPLNSSQWKLVEYIWVSLAFLSVLGFVEEARRYRAETSLRMDMAVATDRFHAVYGWFENYRDFTCEKDRKTDRMPDREKPDFSLLCQAFGKMLSDLDLLIISEENLPEIPPAMTRNLDDLPPLLSVREKDIIQTRVSQYHRAKETYDQTIENAHASPLQQFLLIMIPLFLALALALKMTKVTGEYKILRQAESGRTKPD